MPSSRLRHEDAGTTTTTTPPILLTEMMIETEDEKERAAKKAKTVLSTKDNSTLKKELHVHFGSEHFVCVTVHEFSSNEHGALSDRWYNKEDFQQFKRDQMLSIINYYTNAKRSMASTRQPSPNNTFTPDHYTIRGLEHKCGTAASLKYHRIDSHTHRNIVRRVIFDEQQRQRQRQEYWNYKTFNCTLPQFSRIQRYQWEQFRYVSYPHTKNESDRARWRAQQYEQEEEPEPMLRRRPRPKRVMRAHRQQHARSHSQPNMTMKRNNSRRFLS